MRDNPSYTSFGVIGLCIPISKSPLKKQVSKTNDKAFVFDKGIDRFL